jgi:predicted MFS family arabinose efflux permease
VLVIEFPPLVKNVLTSDEQVASLFLAVFSVGVAVGSVVINRMLKSEVSARYSPGAVIAMAGFVLAVYAIAKTWEGDASGSLYTLSEFMRHPSALALLGALFGVAVTGGIFVVPLYAFLTTTVEKDQTARTVAANNIVNSGSMVAGSLLAFGLSAFGVSAVDQLLMVSGMCFISAWLAWKLHLACDLPSAQPTRP